MLNDITTNYSSMMKRKLCKMLMWEILLRTLYKQSLLTWNRHKLWGQGVPAAKKLSWEELVKEDKKGKNRWLPA